MRVQCNRIAQFFVVSGIGLQLVFKIGQVFSVNVFKWLMEIGIDDIPFKRFKQVVLVGIGQDNNSQFVFRQQSN